MSRKESSCLSFLMVLVLIIPLHAQETRDTVNVARDTIEVTQDTLLSPSPTRTYTFVDKEENRIHNAVSLSDFFERLYRLRRGQNLKVNIIQVGDSHIQADFLSRVVRQSFQLDFGNAGRGLMVPGRVARTNQPTNLISSSPSLWESKRIVHTDKPLPIGIGGITIRTVQPNARITLGTLNTTALDYRFNKITVFFQKDFHSFNMGVSDSINREIAFIGPYTFEPYANTSTVLLPFLTHQVTLTMLPATSDQSQVILFGINLENGKPGVLYHAIGVNGAKLKHWSSATLFADQTAALSPDLFIISLGTNEALDYPYSDPLLTNQLDNLIQQLKSRNPNARFLLTTPSDSFRRKIKRNPGVETVRSKIISYADQNNIAYWDLYTVGGGKHSGDQWKKSGLMQRDGIHFTVKGYELQGNLLYEALTKAYTDYVQYRHP